MIRQLQHKDLSTVGDIWLRMSVVHHAFVCDGRQLAPDDFWSSKLPQMTLDTLSLDGYVFEEDRRIKGFMTFRPEDGYISELFVDSSFQDKGIGTALINVAKSLQQSRIWATVYEKNKVAVKFYEKQGFWRVGDPYRERGTSQMKLKMEWCR